ncbi:hypothetical protein ACH5RR_032434 [Cinchona calisaya]|uniref:Uncharacterized protein n=1 Tax=Cinchona calisaya TaxID=153742 RepID=A0ABD2YL69_9GENT
MSLQSLTVEHSSSVDQPVTQAALSVFDFSFSNHTLGECKFDPRLERWKKRLRMDLGVFVLALAALDVAELPPIPPPHPPPILLLGRNGVLRALLAFPTFDHESKYFSIGFRYVLLRYPLRIS